MTDRVDADRLRDLTLELVRSARIYLATLERLWAAARPTPNG